MSAAKVELAGTAPDRGELLRRAAALAPVLRERAAEGEALRRMPDATIIDLIAAKVLRICQPARFGGSELGWDALCEISIEMARGDGSQAWVANVYAEHAFLLSLFPDAAQREVWEENPDALIAASIVPHNNRIQRVEGGYRLTGRWSFASGVHHAHWVIVANRLPEPAPTSSHANFLVPAADGRVDDDWFTIGMVGTGSATVVLDGVFVPEHRVVADREIAAGEAPGASVNPAPIYRMPFLGFAQLALASVPVGTVRGMVDDFAYTIRGRGGSAGAPPGTELLYERLSEASAEARAASLLLLETARANMDALVRGTRLGAAEAALSMRDAAYAMQLAKRAAGRLFESTGGRGQFLTVPMQRAFRDVHTGASHGSLNWERSAVQFARFTLGEGSGA